MKRRQPFRKASRAYAGSVFAGCLVPLKAGKKNPPQAGRTGADGRTSEKTVRKDAKARPHANVGLRVPTWMIGLDVDGDEHAEGKSGPATIAAFEQRHGALPPGLYSTRHGADSATRIRWFAIPDGVILRERLLRDDPDKHGGVEIIQHHHRFGVIWPSRLTDGTRYQWFDADGDRVRIPQREQIPRLPDAWTDALRDDRPDRSEHRVTSEEVADWIDSLHDGEVSAGVTALIESIPEAEVGNSTLLAQAGPLVRAITGTRGGRAGFDAFVEHVRPAYIHKYSARKFDDDLDRALARAIGDLQAETLTHTFELDRRSDKVPAPRPRERKTKKAKTKKKRKPHRLRHDEYTPTARAGVTFSPAQPLLVASDLIDQQVLPPMRFWRGVWHLYEGGHWSPVDADAPADLLYEALRDATWIQAEKKKGEGSTEMPWAPNAGRVREVLRGIQSFSTIDAQAQWPLRLDGDPCPNLVPVRNGLLDPRTRELHPRTPQVFSLAHLDIEWIPEPLPPRRWLRFLDEIFDGDRKAARLLQEWLGYIICGDTARHKAVLLVGPKRSGKGTILRISEALVGAIGVKPLTMSSFSRNFGLQGIENASLAVLSDLRGSGPEAAQAAQTLLEIAGGDTIAVDRKFLGAVNIRPRARVMVAANNIPRLYDDADAIQSRFLILRTVRSFYQNEDHGLLDDLMTELPSIASWALDGYERLQRRGRFTVPANDEADRAIFSERSAPLTAFIRDVCEQTDDHTRWPLRSDAWAAYNLWARVNDAPALRNFKAAMEDLGFGQVRPRSDSASRPVVYQGIALREDALAELRGQDDSSARKKATALWGTDPIVTEHS